MRHRKHIIGSLVALSLFAVVGTRVFAGETEQSKLLKRISELENEIAENSAEYQSLAPVAAENRSKCELAAMQEKQMAQLNAANSVKRKELEVYQDLLGTTDPTEPQAKD